MFHSIIVGFGLAGFCYARQLQKRGQSFLILDHPIYRGATPVSAGICNPIILRRFTLAWNAPEFFSYSKNFFENYQKQAKVQLLTRYPIFRPLRDNREVNQWSKVTSKCFFNLFFDPQIRKTYGTINKSSFGYGVVNNIFQVDIYRMFHSFLQGLGRSKYIMDHFQPRHLRMDRLGLTYKNWSAQNIVFCQGYGLKSNSLTEELPLVGSKGEMMLIQADQIPSNVILKSKIFVAPTSKQNQFWVGATFDRGSKSVETTKVAREFLIHHFEQSVGVPFQVVNHQAGIRPTVADRRPLLGRVNNIDRAFIFNGLGTRGLMMGPLLSQWLYDFIESEIPLPIEVSVDRFQ